MGLGSFRRNCFACARVGFAFSVVFGDGLRFVSQNLFLESPDWEVGKTGISGLGTLRAVCVGRAGLPRNWAGVWAQFFIRFYDSRPLVGRMGGGTGSRLFSGENNSTGYMMRVDQVGAFEVAACKSMI